MRLARISEEGQLASCTRGVSLQIKIQSPLQMNSKLLYAISNGFPIFLLKLIELDPGAIDKIGFCVRIILQSIQFRLNSLVEQRFSFEAFCLGSRFYLLAKILKMDSSKLNQN